MAMLLTNIKKKMKLYRDPDKYKKSRILSLDIGIRPGVKMIQYKAIVQGSGVKNWETTVQFFGVKFKDQKQGKGFRKAITKGIQFFYRTLRVKEHEVKMKCMCPSYRFEFEKQNFDSKANIGNWRRYRRRTPPRTRPNNARNPNRLGHDFKNAKPKGGDDVTGYCFTGDTKISLLNGQEVPIKDLTHKEEFWVYSCTPEGEIVPGRAHSCKLTRKDVQICHVTLDNDEVIKCTPDHKFMLRDGTYREAQYLKPEDSLMPLYRKLDDNGYECVLQNYSGKWQKTHSMVGYFVDGIKSTWERIKSNSWPDKHLVVHHKDFHKRNNSPENLQWMGENEHWKYHNQNIPEIRKSHPTWNKNVSKAARKRMLENNPIHDPAVEKKVHDATRAAHAKLLEDGTHNFQTNHPMHNEEIKARAQEKMKATAQRKLKEGSHPFQTNHPMKNPKSKAKKTRTGILKRVKFLLENDIEVTPENYKKKGLAGWKFLEKIFGTVENAIIEAEKFNHKVKFIEHSKSLQDVYDFTVDEYDNFALTSGVFVHNCKHIHSLLQALKAKKEIK